MTEKEKMLSGLIYDANYDEELIKDREKVKDMCFEYNYLLKPSQYERQRELMKKILGETKKNFTVTAPFWCDYGYNIKIGENFYANHNVVILDGAEVIFGDNVFIGPNCGFYTAGHPLDVERRNLGLEYAYPIKVGNNVWFGAGVHVMPGVIIGNDTVIAAGSVITKNIPDGVVAGGVPCKVLRKITEEDRKNYTEKLKK